MKEKWYRFDQSKGYRQKRPPIRRWVIVALEATRSHEIDLGVTMKPGVPNLVASYPPGIAVGYRKDAAGDPSCPYFVVPGIGRKVIAWCDCLPDDFALPKWLCAIPGD